MFDPRELLPHIRRIWSENARIGAFNESKLDDLCDWDWISYVDLIIIMERQLGIKLSIAEMSRLKDAVTDDAAMARLVKAGSGRA